MQRKTRFVAVVMLASMSAACATPRPQPVVTATYSPLCLIDKVIPFAMPGAGDDIGNKWDTPDTVAAIDLHNAKLEAVCGDE